MLQRTWTCAAISRVTRLSGWLRCTLVDQIPPIRYAPVEGGEVAYQVFGDGDVGFLMTSGMVQNLEILWEEPRAARFFRRHAAFCRLVLFDKRGTGMSARQPPSSFAERIDDMRAVLDAAGLDQAFIGGNSEGGTMAALFAASYPERTLGLTILGSTASWVRRDDMPWQPTAEEWHLVSQQARAAWGTGRVSVATLAPSMVDDEEYVRWAARYERQSATPSSLAMLMGLMAEIDVRAILPSIHVPTLVLHRDHDSVSVENGRYLARRIPNARLVILPGVDHAPWIGDQDSVLDEIERFVVGSSGHSVHDRFLTTVLFTDIVGSTESAARLGDATWKNRLDLHDAIGLSAVERNRGRVVKSTGDGLLAIFDLPSGAIRAARAIQHDLRHEQIGIRAGLHTGEVERRGDDIGGVAVHAAARISSQAAAGEVLVSSTVKQLCAGAGIEFRTRGERSLKGLADTWALFEVVDAVPEFARSN